MDPKLTNPKVVAEMGERIYRERYQAQLEPAQVGKFLLIDVTTTEAFLSESAEGAFQQAQVKAPQGIFHLIRIGEPGAFRVSYRRDANPDWVVQ